MREASPERDYSELSLDLKPELQRQAARLLSFYRPAEAPSASAAAKSALAETRTKTFGV